MITDLIAETKATKLAINEASESLEEASRATNIIAPPALAFETDLFDWGKEEVAAPVAAPAPSSTQIPPASYPSSSSFDNGSNYGSNSYGQPEAVTSGESQSFYTNSNYGQPDPIRSSESNKEPESQNNYNQAAPNNAFTYNYGGASAQLEKSDLNRDTSLRFGEVMGSGSDLRSLMSGSVDTHSAYNEGVGDVNELTKKAKSAKDALREAESVAVAAEESKQQLLAQADELRRLADEAEKEARDAAAKSSGKKKGVFGRGQKLDIVSLLSEKLYANNFCSSYQYFT